MKHLLGTMAATIISLSAFSQAQKATFSGKVVDEKTQLPVAAATVKIGNTVVIADDQGNFIFPKLKAGSYEVLISSIGYTEAVEQVTVGPNTAVLKIRLKSSALFLQPLEVKALRAADNAPFTKTNLSKEQLAKTNLGQDLPYMLNQTPSVVVNSDAGNGVGYTGIYIRGVDATRINVTLNGIPYNDAESMGSYFVDLPDFTSSLSSVQIQRGVGTSSNGTGAFGATINLQTNEFNEKAYAESNNSYGSFNTWKNTLKAGTGLINGHFTVDARLSRIKSDGYIDRASTDLQSFAFSTAYINKKSSLRLNIFSGKEKTYQAWNGVAESLLATDRTHNDFTYPNQTDNYVQNHYQLFFNHQFSSSLSFNTAVFFTPGKGYYEEYKEDAKYTEYGLPKYVVGTTTFTKTDLVRQLWLDNKFYGQILSLQYKKNKSELIVGGGWSTYEGGHYGFITWAKNGGINKDYQWYNLPSIKKDVNAYAKFQTKVADHFTLFADAQYKHVSHRIDGFRKNPTIFVNRSFDFFNPKAGASYNNKGWQLYASYAVANKEPNSNDLEINALQQPKAERLNNIEVGIEKKTAQYNASATFYYMNYKDQLVLTGNVNDVGEAVRVNVPKSYRMGIELQAGYIFSNWLNANGNITFSKNKITEFTELVDNYDNGTQVATKRSNATIAYSPSIVSSLSINIAPVKNVELSLISKYVGKQYLDNSQNEGRILKDYYTQDARAIYTIKNKIFREWNLIAQVNNVFNRMYESNGYTFSYIYGGTFTTENYYFPMAGTNYMVGVNVKF